MSETTNTAAETKVETTPAAETKAETKTTAVSKKKGMSARDLTTLGLLTGILLVANLIELPRSTAS